MDVDVYTHTLEDYSTVKKKKKNKTLPFMITWMDLKGIMVIEISQTNISLTCGI